VVDDEPQIGEVLQTFFELEGYPTAMFTNPTLALRDFLQAHTRPRLLVTDYVMTPINGMELLARCLQAEPHLPSIIISGNVGEDELLRYDFRPNFFVRKPFQTQKLLKSVQSLIGPAPGLPT
jgi:CheY-like chemotaxis protein